MTYRGHWVLRTLIRCHFSPLESTGQSYIYSGSADGRIHIWSLDGRLVQILNRGDSRPLHQHGVPGEFIDPSEAEAAHPVAPRGPPRQIDFHGFHIRGGHTVRDVAWHAHTPTLMSTCWNHESGRYGSTGSVAMHEWKGLGKGGLHSLEDWVEKAVQEQAARAT
jgi:WD repeat-containing protein 23